MIDIISKEIEIFLSSHDAGDDLAIELIKQKSKISITDNLSKGHLTSNVCMVAASILKKSPKDLSIALVERLQSLELFEKVTAAGPGFINITLQRKDFINVISKILEEKKSYGKSNIGQDEKVQIEFVSANPTGPLHVGHGRGAAYGDAIGRILVNTGSKVEKEYYINDAGRQIDILTASVFIKLMEESLENFFPQNAYKGDYIKEIAKEFLKINKINVQNVNSIKDSLPSDPEDEIDQIIFKIKGLDNALWESLKEFCLNKIVTSIKNDLKKFNVEFDHWFKESALGDIQDANSEISSSIEFLKQKSIAYKKDGAIWLNTEISGDDKHRVLVRDNGRATYFASDVAYHKNKIDRGFDKLINVWGADHHGYIKRIESSIEALGSSKKKLIVKLVQFANLFKNGKKVKMSTRSGEFYTLKDLIDDIGADAARFFYLSKQADQHLDFDIDLAKSDNKENIFYYIQYAHARIFSLEEKYIEKFHKLDGSKFNSDKHDYLKCDDLIHEVSKYPDIIEKAARTLQPHLIIFYLKDLSQLFHSFYNDNHVLSESDNNIQSIIYSLHAVRNVIANGLDVLGITPMKKM